MLSSEELRGLYGHLGPGDLLGELLNSCAGLKGPYGQLREPFCQPGIGGLFSVHWSGMSGSGVSQSSSSTNHGLGFLRRFSPISTTAPFERVMGWTPGCLVAVVLPS